MVGIGVGVAALAGIAFLLMPKSTPKPVPTPATTGTMGSTAPQPAAVVPPSHMPPSATIKKTVTLRFEADPPGAHVFNKQDDKDLGVVPVEVQLPKNEGDEITYVFRLPGYRDKTLNAGSAADRTFHVSLEKAAALAGDAKKKSTHRSPKRAKTHVDEDGLATPSF